MASMDQRETLPQSGPKAQINPIYRSIRFILVPPEKNLRLSDASGV